MARKCYICGKQTSSGNNVSHSHKKIKRVFKPNIHKTKIEINGKTKQVKICTKCLKSGKVKKAI